MLYTDTETYNVRHKARRLFAVALNAVVSILFLRHFVISYFRMFWSGMDLITRQRSTREIIAIQVLFPFFPQRIRSWTVSFAKNPVRVGSACAILLKASLNTSGSNSFFSI